MTPQRPDRSPPAPALLLAGAPDGERVEPLVHRTDPPAIGPAHVRTPRAARSRLIGQGRAGAEIIVAPTFRTSHRHLAAVGEGRRTREWTEAAVTLAREAAEAAAEALAAATGAEPLTYRRAPIRVAGSLSPLLPLDAGAELVDHATALREHRETAGLLADAGVDLLLVEAMAGSDEAGAATLAAVETGLETWSGARPAPDARSLASGQPLEAWLDAVAPLAPAGMFLSCADPATASDLLAWLRSAVASQVGVAAHPFPGTDHDAAVPRLTAEASSDHARAWLVAGAGWVGLSCWAGPAELAPLREALDERLAEREESRLAVARAWQRWVEEAARRAPGGAALWLSRDDGGDASEPPLEALPRGFVWTRAPTRDLAGLPMEAYRLVVSPSPTDDVERLAALLEPGGYLVADLGDRPATGLRSLEVVDLGEATEEGWLLGRHR